MNHAPQSGGSTGRDDARRDRWTAHREARRREFVDAAMRALERRGEPELLIDEVAAEAGVTKPVLYRYFADKAALISALGERGTELLFERLVPAITTDGPPMTRIREAVGAYFAVIDEHPTLHRLLMRYSAIDPAAGAVTDHNRDYIATTLTAVLGDYMRVFGLDSGAAEPWAYGITGLVQSTGEWWLRRRSMSRAHAVEYVTQLIWSALAGGLREAGIEIDPEQPLPEVRPNLTIRQLERRIGN